ncbi:MAG: hypothetical protein JNL62_07825 [Bryobacterales bacterium]|nr:hypothetical protein [Bryobacterales bacterium]
MFFPLLLLPALSAALGIATFEADVTPAIGDPVAYVAARSIEDPLYAKGVVLTGAGKPIVLCAVDWIGIGNRGHDVFRAALAKAARTDLDRGWYTPCISMTGRASIPVPRRICRRWDWPARCSPTSSPMLPLPAPRLHWRRRWPRRNR